MIISQTAFLRTRHGCRRWQVPALDFMALLTLATDGTNSSVRACMDLDTVAHAARLMTGIQVRAEVA